MVMYGGWNKLLLQLPSLLSSTLEAAPCHLTGQHIHGHGPIEPNHADGGLASFTTCTDAGLAICVLFVCTQLALVGSKLL